MYPNKHPPAKDLFLLASAAIALSGVLVVPEEANASATSLCGRK